MSQGFAGILEGLVGPPGGMFLLILIGVAVLQHNQRIAKWLIVTGLSLLYVVSLPITANVLLRMTEIPVSLSMDDFIKPRAQAIVVLGGGRREYAPDIHVRDQQGDTVGELTLERIRYAAWLARQINLPILVSGGLADEDGPAEAILMKEVLELEFGREVRWVETESHNTYENAQISSVTLKENGIDKIYLVTHAMHIKRAKWAFEKQGMVVIPAPTAFMGEMDIVITLRSFLPSARSLRRVSLIFHEITGNIWYRIRY